MNETFENEVKKLWELIPTIIYVSFQDENLIRDYNYILDLENEIKDNNRSISELKVVNDNLQRVINEKQKNFKLLIDKAVKRIEKANKRIDD